MTLEITKPRKSMKNQKIILLSHTLNESVDRWEAWGPREKWPNFTKEVRVSLVMWGLGSSINIDLDVSAVKTLPGGFADAVTWKVTRRYAFQDSRRAFRMAQVLEQRIRRRYFGNLERTYAIIQKVAEDAPCSYALVRNREALLNLKKTEKGRS